MGYLDTAVPATAGHRAPAAGTVSVVAVSDSSTSAAAYHTWLPSVVLARLRCHVKILH